MRRAVFLVPSALTLLLAGCSIAGTTDVPSSGSSVAASGAVGATSGTGPPDAGTAETATIPDDVCSLLSTAEASKAYGFEITEAVQGATSCSYSGPESGFLLTLSDYGLSADETWSIAKTLTGTQTGEVVEVAGIADRAVGSKGFLVAQATGVLVAVTGAHLDQDPDAARAGAVAEAVAARL